MTFIDEKNKITYRNIKMYPLRGTPLNAQPSAILSLMGHIGYNL